MLGFVSFNSLFGGSLFCAALEGHLAFGPLSVIASPEEMGPRLLSSWLDSSANSGTEHVDCLVFNQVQARLPVDGL